MGPYTNPDKQDMKDETEQNQNNTTQKHEGDNNINAKGYIRGRTGQDQEQR